jgi:hypothetical protein
VRFKAVQGDEEVSSSVVKSGFGRVFRYSRAAWLGHCNMHKELISGYLMLSEH